MSEAMLGILHRQANTRTEEAEYFYKKLNEIAYKHKKIMEELKTKRDSQGEQ